VLQGFAGGLLLSGGMLHLLVDSNEIILSVLEAGSEEEQEGGHHHHEHYPWAYLCCTLALATIFWVEKFVESCSSHGGHSHGVPIALQPQEKVVELKEVKETVPEKSTNDTVAETPNETLAEIPAEQQNVQAMNDDLILQTKQDGSEKSAKKPKMKKFAIVKKLISPILLWISLGLHSLFEGLGLGSVRDEKVILNLTSLLINIRLFGVSL